MAYPKGLILNGKNTLSGKYLTIPEGVDFIIADALVNMKVEPGFNKHVQEAYNANIPCIARVDVDPTVYSSKFSLAGPLWDNPDFVDPHLAILDRIFLTPSKTSIYAIDGVILDLRYADATNTGPWISQTAWYLRRKIQERYFGIPVYILTDSKVLTLYPDANSDPQVFFSNQKLLCTQHPASSLSITGNPVIPEPVGSPKPNWQWGIKFWLYGTSAFSFLTGCSSTSAGLVQYRGSLASLYEELTYTPRVHVDDTVETPTEDPIDIPDTNVTVNLTSIEAKLTNIETLLNKIFNYISRP